MKKKVKNKFIIIKKRGEYHPQKFITPFFIHAIKKINHNKKIYIFKGRE
jgi:hypothetical protein